MRECVVVCSSSWSKERCKKHYRNFVRSVQFSASDSAVWCKDHARLER